MLIGTFFAYPSFQKRFGKCRSTIPEARDSGWERQLNTKGIELADGSFQLEASWQIALGTSLGDLTPAEPANWMAGLAPTLGIIVGILMNGYLIDRFGHRMVCLASLFVMCGLFVMTFEPTGLPMLFASQVLLGVPQGCLNTAARKSDSALA